MKHVKAITQNAFRTPEKALDTAGAIFLQVWATVFSMILTGALSQKR